MSVLDVLGQAKVERLGTLASRIQDTGYPDSEPLSVYLDRGVVRRADQGDNYNALGADLSKYQRVMPGDLVFNRLRTWQGGFGASTHEGIVSPTYIVLRPHQSEARFLDYVLHSAPYLSELTRLSKWMPPSQFDILWTDLRTVPIPAIPIAEQRRIAAFLDDRTARIDQIIRARRDQIRLLMETYGAWLDSLVSRFDPVPLRRFLKRIEQGWSPLADSVPATSTEAGVLKLGAVRGGVFDPRENKALLPATEPREEYRILEGDLLVTRANTPALVGDVAVASDVGERRLYLSDLIYRIELSDYDPHLASAALRTSKVRQFLGVLARGTSGSMPKLRGQDLADLPLPDVPRADRARIGALDVAERDSRDRHIASLVRSVNLLTEYKLSLVTAAVSGVVDVTTVGSGTL